jgi:hypothetical protein
LEYIGAPHLNEGGKALDGILEAILYLKAFEKLNSLNKRFLFIRCTTFKRELGEIMHPLSKKNLQKGEVILHKPQLHAVILLKPVIFLLCFALLYAISKIAISGNLGIPSIIAITALFLVMGAFCVVGTLGIVGISVIIACFGSLGVFVVLAASGVLIAAMAQVLILCAFYVSIAASLVWFIVEVLRFSLEEYYVTNKRLITMQILRDGVISSIKDLPISKIESVNCEKGIFGSLLDYGAISVAGIGGVKLKYYYVDKPTRTRRKIYEVIEKNAAVTIVKGTKPELTAKSESSSGVKIDYGTFVSLNTDE